MILFQLPMRYISIGNASHSVCYARRARPFGSFPALQIEDGGHARRVRFCEGKERNDRPKYVVSTVNSRVGLRPPF